MIDISSALKLDPNEQHFRIPGPLDGLSLFLRFLPSTPTGFPPLRAVIYVHGATFPSALSIAFRFDGRSWRDALCEAGFDVWALDFYGFGGSGRYPEMDRPGADNPPLCVAEDAAKQLEAAIRFILRHQDIEKISLISHSWGSMPAGLFAGTHPALVDRLVLFAPIAQRALPREKRRPRFRHGVSSRCRISGTGLSKTFPHMNHRCYRGFISTSGASATSTAIPAAVRAIPPGSKRHSVRSARSLQRGTGNCLTIRRG
jgi:pimeloyl-ACP methyl ester carboxylesterase